MCSPINPDTHRRDIMAELHHDQWLWRFETHLHEQGYKPVTIKRRLSVCGQFVRYLQETNLSIDQVRPPILDAYVQRHVQRYQQRYGRSPRDIRSAKHWFIGGIPQLLRFVQGQWPPP